MYSAARKGLMEAMFHTQRQMRWIYLVVSVILLLCLGLIYAWSIFRVPLENEFGWSKAETSITFSISMMMFCLGGVISGMLTSRRGVRMTMIWCAFALAAGFIGASTIHSLWGIYVTYGGPAAHSYYRLRSYWSFVWRCYAYEFCLYSVFFRADTLCS